MAQFPLILNELQTWVTVDFALGNFTQKRRLGVCVCVCVCVCERERETDRQTDRFKETFWPTRMLTLLSNSLFTVSTWPNAGELKSE